VTTPTSALPADFNLMGIGEDGMKSYEIEEFKNRIDIALVISNDCTLSQDGGRLCGAHCTHLSKSKRSLKVYPDQQSFYCFNCGAGGDVIAYVQDRDGCSFVDALRWLSEKFNVPLPTWTQEQQAEHERHQSEKEIVSNIMMDAFKFYHDTMTDDNRAYLCSRGLFNETIDTELLGYAPGDRALYEALKGKYSDEELLLSGLFYQRKDSKGVARDYYDNRYVFPYWHQKKIVYSIGRTLDPNVEEYKKYIKQLTHKDNHPYVSYTVQNVIYNADSVRKFKRGIITEGIIDALHIKQVQEELEASVISPITTRFSKNDIDRLVELTQHWGTVFIINDTEKNKSGERGALDSAERLFKAGRDVRLVTLPLPEGKDKIDIADFLNVPSDQKASRIDELKQLMESAPDFLEWKIDEVVTLPEREQCKAITPVLEHLIDLPPIEQGYYVDIITKKLNINKKNITDTLKTLQQKQQPASEEETKEPSIVWPNKPIGLSFSLAQDFADDVLSYCIYLPMDFGGHQKLMPHLITSKREAILITQETLAAQGIYFNPTLPTNMNRWSIDTKTNYNIHQFLEGSEVKSVDVFTDLCETFHRFIWHRDSSLHIILSLWTMESYVFMIFDSIGYLSAVATKRAAKTRILELLEELTFNGMMLSGQSEAYTYRKVESDRVTLLLDEADRLAKQLKWGNTLLEQLRSGYKRSGKTGLCEGESHSPTEFSTYSMKAFANATGIEEMLSDRVIILNPERKPVDVKVDRLLMRKEKKRFQLIRNKLYTWALCHAKQIHNTYTAGGIPSEYHDYISDREEEIWAGILAIAKVIDSDSDINLFKSVLDIAKENKQRKIAEEASTSLDSQFLEGILDYLSGHPTPVVEIVDGVERKYYPRWQIEHHLADFLGWPGIKSNKFVSDYLTRLRILEDVRKPNAIRRRINAPRKKADGTFEKDNWGKFVEEDVQMMHYWLDEERIKEIARRYDIQTDD
jgi:DNA primase catalytic core